MTKRAARLDVQRVINGTAGSLGFFSRVLRICAGSLHGRRGSCLEAAILGLGRTDLHLEGSDLVLGGLDVLRGGLGSSQGFELGLCGAQCTVQLVDRLLAGGTNLLELLGCERSALGRRVQFSRHLLQRSRGTSCVGGLEDFAQVN